MLCFLLTAAASSPALSPATSFGCENKLNIPLRHHQGKCIPFVSCWKKLKQQPTSIRNAQKSSYPPVVGQMFHKYVISVAAALAIVFWSNSAHAGILSGFSGIESLPGPQLPSVDFLSRINEENQKKYAENDARFKDSPILKKLLEQSKLNKEKNQKRIADKYCIRGAEWGVGDCSAEAMSPEERDSFISMLKQKAGVE